MAAPITRQRPLVIKIGGSLAASSQLPDWLRAIENIAGQVVIVPGGGALADAVRHIQNAMGFDDLVAHRMALLAMEQYGLALAGLAPRFVPAATPAAIRRVWRLGQIAVWMPAHMLEGASLVPHSWDATSDTLAAWLASELGAMRLLLIKSVDAPKPASEDASVTLSDIAAAGVVDSLFARFAGISGAEIFVAGPTGLADAAAFFAGGSVPGTRISLS
jgi:dihydroneopterin aldolase